MKISKKVLREEIELYVEAIKKMEKAEKRLKTKTGLLSAIFQIGIQMFHAKALSEVADKTKVIPFYNEPIRTETTWTINGVDLFQLSEYDTSYKGEDTTDG